MDLSLNFQDCSSPKIIRCKCTQLVSMGVNSQVDVAVFDLTKADTNLSSVLFKDKEESGAVLAPFFLYFRFDFASVQGID